MSKSLNKIMIIGNLGADPEVRTTQGGAKIANLRIATTDTWNDRDGNRQEHTEWHRVVFFGNTAEVCEKYLSKGGRVYVEGSLRTDKWQDKDGNNRYTTEVRGRELLMLDSAGGQQSTGYDAPPELNDDDLPF